MHTLTLVGWAGANSKCWSVAAQGTQKEIRQKQQLLTRNRFEVQYSLRFQELTMLLSIKLIGRDINALLNIT